MSEIDAALRDIVRASDLVDYDEDRLRRHVDEHLRLGSMRLVDKLREFRGGRAGDLIAELRVSRALAIRFGTPPTFEVGDAPDFHFDIEGASVLVDVVHKSVSDALETVLYPHPDRLVACANPPPGEEWKKPAATLAAALATLPVAVQPWLHGDLLRHVSGHAARAAQERDCSDVVDWLADQLPKAVNDGTMSLEHPRGLARFDLERIAAPPGRINGYGPLDAWIAHEGWFRHDIERKSRKAAERLARGGDCYLVGLAIDEAISSMGHHLQTTVLGPLICECIEPPDRHRNYRPVPLSAMAMYEQARQRGRGELLDVASFDPAMHELHGHQSGLYLDPVCESVAGVAAIYYTEELQFVPNAFSVTAIEPVVTRFPGQLEPAPISST